MARVVFEDLTLEQAKVFADWFEGQGEQDCIPWFEDCNVPAPMADVQRKNWLEEKEDEIVVHCKSYKKS